MISRRLAGLGLLTAVCSVPLLASSATAHPLGNFTVNHYTGVVVRPDAVVLDVVIDHAEIPTFQRRPEIDTDGDRTVSAPEQAAFADAECSKVLSRLRVNVDGRPVAPAVTSSALALSTGEGGLDLMRLTCAAQAPVRLERGGSAITVTQQAEDGRIGWREFTAQGDGVTLNNSSVPAESVSRRLIAYPEDLLQSPLADTGAIFTARPGGAALTPGTAEAARDSVISRGVGGATEAFQRFIGRRELSPLIGLAAFVLAVALGAIHALAPGHGKTVMAAFIVGERGSLRQAWIIGLTVTVTHTLGVLVLGVVLTATDLAAPQRVYGLLGAASGLLLGGVGVVLLARALRQRALLASTATADLSLAAAAPALVTVGGDHDHGHDHGDHQHGGDGHDDGHDGADHGHDGADDHGHDHGHQDHDHDHDHEPDDNGRHRHGLFSHRHVVPTGDKPLGLRSIVAMGFAGGLVPSPSALVVLLGSVALGRTWFGVVLVIAYGAGMAVTLTGTGLLLSRASGRIGAGAVRYSPRMQRAVRLARLLPLVTAAVVLTVGVVLTFQGLREAF